MSAAASVVDREAQLTLQRVNSYLAIAFGIGASVVAALLLDILRSPNTQRHPGRDTALLEESASIADGRESAPIRRSGPAWLPVLGTVLVVSAIRRARRRRH